MPKTPETAMLDARKNPGAMSLTSLVKIDLGDGKWDNPTMVVTLDSKRRLTVPASLAPTAPGEYFDAHFDVEEDAIVFRRLPKKGKDDWLSVLKECPVSMDDIPARRREGARRRKL